MSPREILRVWRAGLSPGIVLLGALAGFVGMCLLGRVVARQDYHDNFTRFTPWMAPDTKYYPTVNEMISIVRHQVKPGQILVIVGGNSVLLGVGQPPAHVWTQSLQRSLGDRYCVINLAFRGAHPTNCGAVVAEALRDEFPRQIYIGNIAPGQLTSPQGSTLYRTTNMDALYKGMLIDDPVRDAEIRAFNADPAYAGQEFAVPELRIREWLDSIFFFQDFWNFVAFTQANTVWGEYLPGAAGFADPFQFLSPRNAYSDPEPDFLQMPLSSRFLASTIDIELKNVRDVSQFAFRKGADGKWEPSAPMWDGFMKNIAGAFPQQLKKRTLILLGYNSPFYLSRLAADEQERNDLCFRQAAKAWEDGGYKALVYGRNYTLDDYGDRTHMTWHGGQKLARAVAVKVRDMAGELGYLRP